MIASANVWINHMGVYIFNHVESKSKYNGNKLTIDFDSRKDRYQDNPYCKIEIGADWVGVTNYVYKITARKIKEDGTLMLRLKDEGWNIIATLEILSNGNINFYDIDDGKVAVTTWYTKKQTFRRYDIFSGTIGNRNATLITYPMENPSPNGVNSLQAQYWFGPDLNAIKSLSGEFSYGRDIYLKEENNRGTTIGEWFCMILQCDSRSKKMCITGSATINGKTMSVDLKQV